MARRILTHLALPADVPRPAPERAPPIGYGDASPSASCPAVRVSATQPLCQNRVIPGCYLGDVAPKDAGLPATCDQSRAVTFRP